MLLLEMKTQEKNIEKTLGLDERVLKKNETPERASTSFKRQTLSTNSFVYYKNKFRIRIFL